MYTHGISHTYMYMYMYHYSDYCMNSVSFFVQNSYNDIIISIFVAYLHRQNHNPNLHVHVPNLTCNTYPIMIYTCTYKCTVQVHKMRHITHMKIINSTCTYILCVRFTTIMINKVKLACNMDLTYSVMHQSTLECHTDTS